MSQKTKLHSSAASLSVLALTTLLAACESATKPEVISDGGGGGGGGGLLAHLTVTPQTTDTIHGRVVGLSGAVDSGGFVVSVAVGAGTETAAQHYPPSPTTGRAGYQAEAYSLTNGKNWIHVRARVSGTLVGHDSFSVVVDVPDRHYTATVIDPGGSVDIQALYLSNDGRLAGEWRTHPDTARGFTWKAGAFVALDSMKKVTGLNNVGQVLGWSGLAALSSQSLIWKDGAYQVANGFTGGLGISDQGRVVRTLTVGYWQNDTVVNYVAPPATGPINVVSINNSGMLAGSRINATQRPTPVIWPSSSTWIVPPSPPSVPWLPSYRVESALRVGDGGQVLFIGSLVLGLGPIPGFSVNRTLFYTNGQTQDLSSMVGFTTVSGSVNAVGTVAGTYVYGTATRGFTWSNGRTTDVVVDTPGWIIENIYSINDQGQLSARAYNSANHRVALILTPVP